jgi:hypothetical protein
VVVNHVVLFWTSGFESWCVILSHWLWIMVCCSEPVVANHDVLFWASGCETWCAILIPVVVNRDVLWRAKWLWIMMWYAKPSGWESRCAMPNQWFWIVFVMMSQSLLIMVYYAEPVDVNHGVLSWASCCESWFIMLSQWLWIMVSYAERVVVNHGVQFWTSGC